ncbi:CLUMA_CG015774, isoform A [Clunio marinus]|uniref:CLUMA_CG015774, isoform A n=1 Tax=Clunio marinus TaxID=568069 RepID=A0A1J1IT51_9DIPT|nr:CLUMA_CG015774, isoform A [Clunio marinus]
MSKKNQSRIPMRGFSSQIPTLGSSTSSPSQQSKMTSPFTPANTSNIKSIATKVNRPTEFDVPQQQRGLSHSTQFCQKRTQITKASESNLTPTSRTNQRPYTDHNNYSIKKEIASQKPKDEKENVMKKIDAKCDEELLFDETIDLVGSEENLNDAITLSKQQYDIFQPNKSLLPSSSTSLTETKAFNSENCLLNQNERVKRSRDDNSNQSMKKGSDYLRLSLSQRWISQDQLPDPSKLLCMTPEEDAEKISVHHMEIDEVDDEKSSQNTPYDDLNIQKRFSFGFDITDCNLDCSLELVDTSISSMAQKSADEEKQLSYDVDESLGILTPDQMKEFLDSTATNHSKNLELPILAIAGKMNLQYRMDQTPSPEELPLDPIGVKTDNTNEALQQVTATTSTSSHQEHSQNDSDPKTEMTKSGNSKISNSIITSITSITSLDTGYIGDGELSRPTSRGADQTPSKAPREIPAHPVMNFNRPPPAAYRCNDPMTDSDFFTESDADDIIHQRENQRRAQVIDGQLYGPMVQGANVFIQHQLQSERDTCMESSGVFTDVENCCGDEYVVKRENNIHNSNVMSPDLSSDTLSSSHTACSQKNINTMLSPSSPAQLISEHRHAIATEPLSSVCNVSMIDECVNLISDVSNNSCSYEEKKNSSISLKAKKAIGVKKSVSVSRKKKNEENLSAKKIEKQSSASPNSSERMKVVSKIKSEVQEELKNKSKKSHSSKWESVMNKITENINVKKNFDNVKSKVTCGAVKRTLSSKAPSFDDHGSSMSSRQFNGNKCGRTPSKKLQQRSQSDLTTTGASPIVQRPNKKCNVIPIDSSVYDSSPPPVKTCPTNRGNGTIGSQKSSPRTISNLHKQNSPKQNEVATITISKEFKKSPLPKKTLSRTTATWSATTPEKSPTLRDNKRSIAPSLSIESPRSSIRSNHSSKSALQPLSNSKISENVICLSSSPKAAKINKIENNNSSRIVNKNNKQKQVDQKAFVEDQKQKFELLNAYKGVEALGVLVQYLVYKLDAFSCPSLKESQQKLSKKLLEVQNNLNETNLSHQNIIEKSNEREEYFKKREIDIHELHQREIATVKKQLEDLENERKVTIEGLEEKLLHNQRESEINFLAFTKNADEKLSIREAELQSTKEREESLLKRIQTMTITEDELREKVHKSEMEFSEKLHHANIRDQELNETIIQLTKRLEETKTKSEIEICELKQKLNLYQSELKICRQSQNSNESFLNKSVSLNQSQLLQDEVESLQCVLKLKQSEISDLRIQNGELQRAVGDTQAAQAKCSVLESRLEDLKVQLGVKHEEEKDLLKKVKQTQESHDNIHKKLTRLSMHNEELQWRLKQNAERYSHTINELSKSYHELSSINNRSNATFSEIDMSHEFYDDNERISPPISPIVKGVIEKSDSVSWVLEIDDEEPEVLASRMVRRAGSFRSDKCSPSPIAKRKKCQNNTSIQQSASASLINQHLEPLPQGSTPANKRNRSKSLSANKVIRETKKKVVRSVSNTCSNTLDAEWKQFDETGEAMVSCSNSEDEEENSASISSCASTGPSTPSINSSNLNNQELMKDIKDPAIQWEASEAMTDICGIFYKKTLKMNLKWMITVVIIAFVSCVQCTNQDLWQPKLGCHLVGYTRKVSIPDCIEFSLTTNACRGFCESFAVSSNFAVGTHRPDQPITSVAQCCNIMESEDMKVKVGCIDGKREVTFKSATRCSCFHCKKS